MAIYGAGVWLAMTMRQPSFCAFMGVGSPPVCLHVRVAGGLLFWWCYWVLVVLLGFGGVDNFYVWFIGGGFLDE